MKRDSMWEIGRWLFLVCVCAFDSNDGRDVRWTDISPAIWKCIKFHTSIDALSTNDSQDDDDNSLVFFYV